MRMNLEQCVWVMTVAVGVGIGRSQVEAVAAPPFQEHEQDIRKTKNISKVCAKARITMRTAATNPGRGTSKETKTRKRTRLATRRVRQLK
jgi:hypothetical protein